MSTSVLVKRLAAGAVSLIGLANFASAANALTLAGSSGTWSNVVGGSGVEFQTVGSENQVRWGTPLGSGKSGLGFSGVGSSTFEIGDVFQIGTLRHFNSPITFGTNASSADLDITLNFLAPAITQAFTFTFSIAETINQAPASSCPFPSTIPCSDKISFPSALGSSSFSIDGVNYTLQLLGFSNTPGGSLVSEFISEEGGTNSAFLYGKITSMKPTAVPEPGSVMGILGFAALGAGSIWKRKQQQKV
jgi:PEP-CTERM motif